MQYLVHQFAAVTVIIHLRSHCFVEASLTFQHSGYRLDFRGVMIQPSGCCLSVVYVTIHPSAHGSAARGLCVLPKHNSVGQHEYVVVATSPWHENVGVLT